MSKLTHTTHDLSEAINLFLKELPDPKTSVQSTFVEDFLVEDKKITLQAQKSKGIKGMIWNIDVRKYQN
jgi:hypothetical protein